MPDGRILVDADACPVKAEAEAVATRYRLRLVMVSNGGLRPSANPLVQMVYVGQGLDEADRWIADQAGPADLVVTADIPLAARAVEKGARVITPKGEVIDARNAGERLAMRDLLADLRSADPLRPGGGKPFGKAERSRFADTLDRLARGLPRG